MEARRKLLKMMLKIIIFNCKKCFPYNLSSVCLVPMQNIILCFIYGKEYCLFQGRYSNVLIVLKVLFLICCLLENRWYPICYFAIPNFYLDKTISSLRILSNKMNSARYLISQFYLDRWWINKRSILRWCCNPRVLVSYNHWYLHNYLPDPSCILSISGIFESLEYKNAP